MIPNNPPEKPVLARIGVSAGGMPKKAVPSALVTVWGVEGDKNLYRLEKKENDPDQAILLIPGEHIERLKKEGWALQPGSLGENFTTRGLEYERIRAGDVYAVGSSVRIQITKPCEPCSKLLPYGGAKILKALAGRRGWYARVLGPGRVSVGDPIGVEQWKMPIPQE